MGSFNFLPPRLLDEMVIFIFPFHQKNFFLQCNEAQSMTDTLTFKILCLGSIFLNTAIESFCQQGALFPISVSKHLMSFWRQVYFQNFFKSMNDIFK